MLASSRAISYLYFATSAMLGDNIPDHAAYEEDREDHTRISGNETITKLIMI